MSTVFRRRRFRRDHRWTPSHLSAYIDAELRTRARARIDRHVAECPECRGVLDHLRRMVGILHRLPPVESGEDVPDIAAAVRRRLREPAER